MKYTKGISKTLRMAMIAFLSCIMILTLTAVAVSAMPNLSASAEEQPSALYVLGDDSIVGRYGAESVGNDAEANGYRTVSYTNGVPTYTYSKHASGWLEAMQEATASTVEVRLVSDWTAETTDRILDGVQVKTEFGPADQTAFHGGSITVVENASVILDLNGYIVDRNLASGNTSEAIYSAIYLDTSATLILKDSNAESAHDGVDTKGGIVTGGNATNGGGVYANANSTFTMEGGSIVGNKASGYGAGVYMSSACTFTMEGGCIAGNESANHGAGVYVSNNSTFRMNAGSISNNKTKTTGNGNGGGVYAVGIFTLNAGEITGNEASSGAGVYVSDQFVLGAGKINGNKARNLGGGLYAASSLTMRGGKIENNEALVGGGVYAATQFTMTDGDIILNKATNNGGGVYANGALTMRGGNINISRNKTTGSNGNGGGVYADGTTTVGGNVKITLNQATNGGGVYVGNNGTFTMENGSSVSDNQATNGGAVYAAGMFILENGGKLFENRALDGGAVYANKFTMNGGEISLNNATGNGGAVYVNGQFTMRDGVITENTVTGNGAGVYVTDDTNTAFTLSGTPKIYDNHKDETANDCYLLKAITVGAPLEDGAHVGIADGSIPAFITNYNTQSQHPSKHFFANDGKMIVLNGAEVSLAEGPAVVPAFALTYGGAEGTVEGNVITYVYEDGSALAYEVTDSNGTVSIKVNGAESSLGTVADAGTYYVELAIDGYVKAYTVVIQPRALTEGDLTLPALSQYTYDGLDKMPAVAEIPFGTVNLVENTDYTVAYEHYTNPGKATAKVTFKGNYSGEVVLPYDIVLRSGQYNVTWEYYVNGWTTTKPTFTFIPGEQGDQRGNIRAVFRYSGDGGFVKYAYAKDVTDYRSDLVNEETLCQATVEIWNPQTNGWDAFKEVGEYEVSILGATEDGVNISYSAFTLTMAPHNVNADAEKFDVRISGANGITYNGAEQRPAISVTLDSLPLSEEEDYLVEYLDNVEGGTATVKITFIGNYTGDPLTQEFTIRKAANVWVNQLSVSAFNCGEFEADNNLFIVASLYGTNVQFAIYAANEENPLIANIAAVRVEDDIYGTCYKVSSATSLRSINALGAGSYRLVAWLEGTDSYDGLDEASVTFSIFKAQNSWTTIPGMHDWTYGSFNSAYNLPVGVARHGAVTFVLTDEAGNVKGLTDEALESLNAGDYTLTATVAETATYDGLEAVVSLKVHRAGNRFVVAPMLLGWTYKSFNEMYNMPAGEALHGNDTLRFVVRDRNDNDKVYFDSLTGVNNLKYLPAGDYNLETSTNGTENYDGLDTLTPFKVTKAINVFTVMPNIRGWKYGSYNKDYNLPEGEAENGTINLYVSTDALGRNIVYSNAPNGKDTLASIKAGDYYLNALTSSDSNYEGLTIQQRFTVEKATNVFTTIPTIPVWRYGEYDPTVNMPIYEAKYGNGDTKIVIIDAEGNEVYNSETDKDLLGEQPVGEYTLIATVPGDDDYYEELIWPHTFNITPCPNSWVDGELPMIESWVTGKFTDENLPVANPKYGTAVIVITTIAQGEDEEGEVIFDSSKGINKLKDLAPGTYYMISYVEGTDNYYYMEYSRFFKVLEPVGLPWWATLLITVGALGIAALVLFILWKLGVFQILTNKLAMALIKRATVDATIAAVRANKRTNEANEHVSKVKAQERLDAARKAQREATPEDVAEGMQERAKITAEKATEMQQRANKMSSIASKYASAPTEETLEEFNEVLTEEEFVEQFSGMAKAEEPVAAHTEAPAEKPAE